MRNKITSCDQGGIQNPLCSLFYCSFSNLLVLYRSARTDRGSRFEKPSSQRTSLLDTHADGRCKFSVARVAFKMPTSEREEASVMTPRHRMIRHDGRDDSDDDRMMEYGGSPKHARYIGTIMITTTIAPCAVKYPIH